MPSTTMTTALRQVLHQRDPSLILDDATSLLRPMMTAIREGKFAQAQALSALYSQGSPLPRLDTVKLEGMVDQAFGTRPLAIHAGPRKATQDDESFNRSLIGLELGTPIAERVAGTYAEWRTAQTRRCVVTIYQATTPSVLYADARWTDSPTGKRKYIASATVVDLEDPTLPLYTLTTAGFRVTETLKPAERFAAGSFKETVAMYLACHSRVRPNPRDPIDCLGIA